MEIHLEDLDRELAFNVKLQISLILNAQRIMNVYPEKRERFIEYINERKEKIRELLNTKNAKIYEKGIVLVEI